MIDVDNSKLEFSVMVNDRYGYHKIKEITLECEKLGYAALWMPDHLQRDSSNAECWTTLSALASQTERIRLGSLVTNNTLRMPSIFAKMIANLDNISNGRIEIGYGTGHVETESRAYGVNFPKPGVRIAMMVEGIKILKMMLKDGGGSFQGKYYQIEDAICDPSSVQRPHPPILIGSRAGKRMMRITARYANRAHFMAKTKPDLFNAIERLKQDCQKIGRPYDSITKTGSMNVAIAFDDAEIEKRCKYIYKSRSRVVKYEDWLKVAKDIDIIGLPHECINKINEHLSHGINYFVLKFPLQTMINDLRIFNDYVIATNH